MKCIHASRSALLATATAAAVLLTGCGSSEPEATSTSSVSSSTTASSTPTSTTSSSSSTASSTTSTSSTSSTVSSSSADETSASTTSTSSSATEAPSEESPAPGTESTISGSGGVIKAGAAAALPAAVGAWAKGGTDQYPTYTSGGSTIIVSFLAGSDYDGLATNVTNSRTTVGSGVCGSTSSETNLTCYLETEDGVINASADAGDTPLVALVDFADQLTTTLGTS